MGDDPTQWQDDELLPVQAPESLSAAGPSVANSGSSPGLIVGIGASAGGLEAYRSFFAHMPPDSGMAFILVQHLSPDHDSLLAELLGKVTGMRVIQAADGVTVDPDCVFVIPPDATMTITGGRLKVVKPAPPRDQRRPIDTFFESLAMDRGENAIGIILSGTGSDGSIGVVAIKEHGGLTLAQAEFDHQALQGMPRSASLTGHVDEVLAVEEMPARITAYQSHLSSVADKKDREGARQDAASHLSTIMKALRARTGHDFGEYKEKTLLRRLQRRMQVLQLDTPDAYIALYREQPEELDLLFRELLIGVTQFFRDPAAFEALSATVLSDLVAAKGADEDLRIWVPGCATGEEVYTIAILVREAMAARRSRPRVQIFGTDIDDRAVAIARQGRYRSPIAGVSGPRLERWFTDEDDECGVVPEIRDMCVFSAHSVIKHPPFSRLDLISCRNFLIYVDPPVQDRIMRTFHYALKPGGHLFLGSSESVARSSGLFLARDKKHRIFERRAIEGLSLPDVSGGGRGTDQKPAAHASAATAEDHLDKSARRVMERYYPPHVVIDRRHQIVRFSPGAIGQYLEPSPGAPSFALFDILHKALRGPVRAVLQEVQASNGAARREHLPVRVAGLPRLVTLIAEPMGDRGAEAGLIVLAFQDGGAGVSEGTTVQSSESSLALEQELRTTRAQLQATIDELEFANEEMKSSNEEYQSVNEELQSSNEELETAKEEMQSVNEELQTINVEMANKNDLLGRLNSDLKNLLESTEIASLFLDKDLRVRSYTAGVTDIFHLRDADIGRPITEIVSLLDYSDLARDVRSVLRKLAVVERQVALLTGEMTFVLRMRPYRTLDNVIDGVVLTFVDITERDAADAARHQTEAYLRLLVDSTADGIYCVDRDGATTLCNASFLRMFGFEREEDVIGRKLHDLIHHAHPDGSRYPIGDCPIDQTARTGKPAHRDDENFFRADGTAFPVEYWSRPIVRGGELAGAVCSFVDITDRRLAEEQQGLLLKEMDHRVQNLFAIIGSVVTLSARSSKTPGDLAATIQGRLGALASAHQLIRAGTPGVDLKQRSSLGELVHAILAPYLDPGSDTARVLVEGTELAAGREAVTSLALVLHELATNAAKYGALSLPDGRVRVRWVVDGADLVLTWEESGGPPIHGAPTRKGFGSMLANRSVTGQLRGKLAFDWNGGGLIVRLTIPVERLTP
ncbi:PAS domain S-box protein [Sphingomonas gei]|uniref:PAS domain S-box protein n=1 Tax=Sphingomonas gei TaxID=1395960 RepID=A0A4S1XGB1_9SPHN|nr:chemotaxis protein CheB [Sphingomonas gei]TGX54977.1 PAS domain S-box protein [Sphingomonas gei]